MQQFQLINKFKGTEGGLTWVAVLVKMSNWFGSMQIIVMLQCHEETKTISGSADGIVYESASLRGCIEREQWHYIMSWAFLSYDASR